PDNVYVTTGQLTAMLRARWGLNSLLGDDNKKERTDHRHHAIDAIVVGAIDRSLLQEMSRRAAQAEGEDRHDVTRAGPEPVAGVREAEAAEIGNLVFRKPLVDLNPNEIDRVRDPVLRAELQKIASQFTSDDGKLLDDEGLRAALEEFAKTPAPGRMQGIRRVRIGKKEKNVIFIRDRRSANVYKALIPGSNNHIDVVQMRDGSWQGFAASLFEVNQPGWRPVWERNKLGGKLVMRLHKGDMIELDDPDGKRRIKVVHRLQPSQNRIYLAPHNEGG